MEKINNKNIEFGSYQPEESEFITLGRKMKIFGPPEAMEIIEKGKKTIPEIFKFFSDETRDYAANALLYQIADRSDAMRICGYAGDIREWREIMKDAEENYWREWIKEQKLN